MVLTGNSSLRDFHIALAAHLLYQVSLPLLLCKKWSCVGVSSLWVLGSVGRPVGAKQAHSALDCQGHLVHTAYSFYSDPKHPERAPTRLIKVEGNVYNGVHLHLLSHRFPADSGEPLWFPISLFGLLLGCSSEAVQWALSCLLGVTALYVGAYFDMLVGRGELSVHLCHGHPVPLHYIVLWHESP